MVRGLQSSTDGELGWLGEFSEGEFLLCHPRLIIKGISTDFRRRFLVLLSFKFREFSSIMGLSVLEAANAGVRYLDSDRKLGCIYCIVSTVLLTYVPRLSPEFTGAFIPVHTL